MAPQRSGVLKTDENGSMTTIAEPAETGQGATAAAPLRWHNRFAALGPAFFTRLSPQPLPDPYWVGRSRSMARELGLDEEWMESWQALKAFSGNGVLPGSDPLASVYSGHQFGHWAGQLGDGRALLLGEVVTPDAGTVELQLKGSGLTPYSRMGDGRAVLRSSIREFLCSEAMHALGVPSSRALCVTGSDAPVYREQVETAAVVTRVAPSFIRFGHFEHFSHSGQTGQLKTLADFAIDAFYPQCRHAPNPFAALLETVSERTAQMVARWQAVGFCHGVMNTDNMSILGLTIDYGPFQFLDGFDPDHICNHSDPQGRYAYNRQPGIAYWNLFALGQALLPLIGEPDDAMAALEPFKVLYPQAYDAQMRAKLGLPDARPGDRELIADLLKLLADGRVDYTIFWRRLSMAVAFETGNLAWEPVRDLFADRATFDAWRERFAARLQPFSLAACATSMRAVNPVYVLRNHLGEQAIRQAQAGDFSEVQKLLDLLQSPFTEVAGCESYAAFPPDWASSIQISCSS